jgi:predicted nicotinamide N-methyase
MPGYLTKQDRVSVAGVDDLVIRSLLDRQQFADPHGQALRLGISSAAWPLFGLLWPSAMYLAVRMAVRPVRAQERILELGCGLALASLVGHRRGADMTASDCHPLTSRFLLENLRLNQLPPMKYRHGHWGAWSLDRHPGAASSDPGLLGQFGLIMASDVLYERDEQGSFADFICQHAAQDAEVWIVDPDRGNRPAFNKQMALRGFFRTEERLRQTARADASAYKGRMMVFHRHSAQR